MPRRETVVDDGGDLSLLQALEAPFLNNTFTIASRILRGVGQVTLRKCDQFLYKSFYVHLQVL